MGATQAAKKPVPVGIRKGFVSGHDFSRADQASKSTRASVPAGSPFRKTLPIAACLPILIPLTGCKPVGPNYSRPGFSAPPVYKEAGASTVLVPPPNPDGGAWQPANPSDGMLKGKWWEIYQDPQLNALEERIAAVNQGLRQALETYLAAEDQVKAARSALYPTLSAGPSVTHNKNSSHRPLSSTATLTNYNDLIISGQASWEPDFWGRIRRTVEAAHENAQASAADMANVNLSLQSTMATDYFQLRGLDSEIKLLTATVADLEHQLDLTQRLFNGGIGTAADVAQAQTQLETVRAQLIDVGVARAQFEHAVGTIADYKLPGFSIPFSPLDLQLPKVPLGVPSQLLERRPDIAAAERRTAAANAQIGIAVSAFYPTIDLTGQGGFESTHAGTWIQGPSALWSLGAQATELLFDAGQRHALTAEARHNYEAQVSAYKGAIFLAFNDVEDQLSGLRILENEYGVQEKAVDFAQHSYDISNRRYKGGATSYLEVLTAEATLIQNQRTAIDLETRQFVDSVGLIRSLGGGWDMSQLPK
jgi:NodT family efflux transporter outer membrane factor (OMF) lipoprotein